MIQQIAYYSILGFPVIMYMGILTLLSFMFTALVGFMIMHGKPILSLKWHGRLAYISISFAIMHAIFGLSSYFFF